MFGGLFCVYIRVCFLKGVIPVLYAQSERKNKQNFKGTPSTTVPPLRPPPHVIIVSESYV